MNNKNLKPQNKRTKSEQREVARKGGKASGKARRKKAELRALMQAALNSDINVDGQTMTGAEMIVYRLMEAVNTPESRNFGKALDTIIKLTDDRETESRALDVEIKELRAGILKNNEAFWTTKTTSIPNYEPDPLTQSLKELIEDINNKKEKKEG